MYTENQLVGIAKRENNQKRNYLVVNRLQGKHVPVSPNEAMRMFGALADAIKQEYSAQMRAGERLLLVGFAETATAIGAAVAAELGTNYIQTTREQVEDADYLYFTEAHSHATEQRLVKNDIDRVIAQTDRIIFIEDEVTTGNTILNIIDIIEKEYRRTLQFSVASLLNGMEPEALARYRERGIAVCYLVKTAHRAYAKAAEVCRGDGRYTAKNTERPDVRIREISVGGCRNARRMVNGASYQTACGQLWEQLETRLPLEQQETILVVGTEEFMYPALYVAKKIEDMGKQVKCHATTRSPIAVSTEPDYPLHHRFELASLYEKSRTTWIYDLALYDAVYILTDANPAEPAGVYSLVHALHSCGNHTITLICWKREAAGEEKTEKSELSGKGRK